MRLLNSIGGITLNNIRYYPIIVSEMDTYTCRSRFISLADSYVSLDRQLTTHLYFLQYNTFSLSVPWRDGEKNTSVGGRLLC